MLTQPENLVSSDCFAECQDRPVFAARFGRILACRDVRKAPEVGRRFPAPTTTLIGDKTMSTKAWYIANREHKLAYSARWYVQNREKRRTQREAKREETKPYFRAYYLAHKEEKSARNKAYRALHRDVLLIRDREYAAAHREEKRLASKNWRDANGERHRAVKKIYHRLHPEVHDRASKKRRAREAGVVIGNCNSISSWELRWKKKKSVICYWCQKRFSGNTCQTDHIIPLALGGGHLIENLCISCTQCNQSKHSTHPTIWNERISQPVLNLV